MLNKGLYKSIYGKTDQGIFDVFYSREGSSGTSRIHRSDLRLGDADDDEDDKAPAASGATPPPGTSAAPTPTEAPSKKPFFSRKFAGLPVWLIAMFVLGVAWSYRNQKKNV